jgi:hypothetical protein
MTSPRALERVALRPSDPDPKEPVPAAAPGDAGESPPAPLSSHVCVLLLFAFAPRARLWGFGGLALGRYRWRHEAGLRFCKSLGSGFEGGFGLRPSGSRQGLFCVFEDEGAADRFLAGSSFLQTYLGHAQECLSVKLRAYSSRGAWSGMRLPLSAPTPRDGPIASLTRASIRPSVALAFWRKAPPAERSLATAPGCLLAVGLGEAPVLRQATFSIWESVAAMDAYARSGAHLEAIRAAHREQYFSESMFVRFVPTELRGVWKGRQHG